MIEELKQPSKYVSARTLSKQFDLNWKVLRQHAQQSDLESIICNHTDYYDRLELTKIAESLTHNENAMRHLAPRDTNSMVILHRLFEKIETEDAALSRNEIYVLTTLTADKWDELDFTGQYRQYKGYERFNVGILKDLTNHGYKLFKETDFVDKKQLKKILGWNNNKLRVIIRLENISLMRLGNGVVYRTDLIKKLKKLDRKYISLTDLTIQYDLNKRFIYAYSKRLESYIVAQELASDGRSKVTLYTSDVKAEVERILKDEFRKRATIASAAVEREQKQTRQNLKNLEDIKLYYFKPLKKRPEICKTVRAAYDFLDKCYDQSKSKEPIRRAIQIARRLASIISEMDKELMDHSQEDLIVLSERCKNGAKRELPSFSQYVHAEYKCAYALPLISKPVKSNRVVSYTDSEWNAFLKDIANVKVHIPLAEKSKLYAQMWVLLLAHTFLCWRKMDFRYLPIPSIEIKNNLGRVTETDAIILIEDMRNQCKSAVAQKNGKPLQWGEVPRPFLIPFAVAVMICAMHRANDEPIYYNHGELLRLSCINEYARIIEKCGLKENIHNFEFSSMRANKTIASGVWKRSIEMPDITVTAFTMAAVMRAHRNDPYKFNDTTPIYITPAAEYTSELQVAITKRGLFGFNAENILNIITFGNAEALNLIERAESVSIIGEAFAPSVSDRMAQNMLVNLDKQRDFIREWETHGKEMEQHIIAAIKSEGCSKTEGVVCARGFDCPNAFTDNCLDCFYSMITLQMAAECGRRTIEVLKEINNLGEPKNERDLNTKLILEKQLAKRLGLVKLIKDNAGEDKTFLTDIMKLNEIECEMRLLK